MIFKAVDANITASCIQSMLDATDRLTKVELENELAAANTYADIIMFNAEILCIIITGFQELREGCHDCRGSRAFFKLEM